MTARSCEVGAVEHLQLVTYGTRASIDDLEYAVAEYIDWFTHRRLHTAIRMIPPVEAEQRRYDSHHDPVRDRERATMSPRWTRGATLRARRGSRG